MFGLCSSYAELKKWPFVKDEINFINRVAYQINIYSLGANLNPDMADFYIILPHTVSGYFTVVYIRFLKRTHLTHPHFQMTLDDYLARLEAMRSPRCECAAILHWEPPGSMEGRRAATAAAYLRRHGCQMAIAKFLGCIVQYP